MASHDQESSASRAYERRMLTVFTREPSGRRVFDRDGLSLQAIALARSLVDSDRVYRSV
jgi:hypothetical protein